MRKINFSFYIIEYDQFQIIYLLNPLHDVIKAMALVIALLTAPLASLAALAPLATLAAPIAETGTESRGQLVSQS